MLLGFLALGAMSRTDAFIGDNSKQKLLVSLVLKPLILFPGNPGAYAIKRNESVITAILK